MIKVVITILIIVIVLLGLIVLTREIYQHVKKQKLLSQTSLKWKFMVLIIGLFILVEKGQFLMASLH